MQDNQKRKHRGVTITIVASILLVLFLIFATPLISMLVAAMRGYEGEGTGSIIRDMFSHKERIIAVYPFEIDCIDTLIGTSPDERCVYIDDSIKNGDPVVVYMNEKIFNQISSALQHPSDSTKISLDSLRIIYDNAPLIYNYSLYYVSDVEKMLGEIEGVKYHTY